MSIKLNKIHSFKPRCIDFHTNPVASPINTVYKPSENEFRSATPITKEQEQNIFTNKILEKYLSDKDPEKSYEICGSIDQFKKIKEEVQSPQNFKLQCDPKEKFKNKIYKVPKQIKKADVERKVKVLNLSKEQVEEELQNVIGKMNQQKVIKFNHNIKLLRFLPKGERLEFSKEERIIKKFEVRNERWQEFINQSISKVNRNKNSSVYGSVELHRSREERKQILDALQTDSERFGNNMWKLSLRRPQSSLNDKNPYEFIEKRENNEFSDRSCPIIEIIRKPGICYDEPSKQFKTNYYTEKLLDRKEILEKVVYTKEKDIENMQLNGKSVIQMELQNILSNLDHSHQFTKIEIDHDQEDLQEPKEEIIVFKQDKSRNRSNMKNKYMY